MCAKVGHFTPKGFVSYVEGPEDYCRGWRDGYNLYADVCVVLLVGDRCECGPLREEMKKPAQPPFKARTGCLRCDRWDSPLELRNEVTPWA